MNLTHLQKLEAESIHIMREVAAEFDNPVMLYSVGKDSAVLLHLARKAFAPGKIPFPLFSNSCALSSYILPFGTAEARIRFAQRLDLSVNRPTTCLSAPEERGLWRGVATPLGAGSGAAGNWCVRAPVGRGALRNPATGDTYPH